MANQYTSSEVAEYAKLYHAVLDARRTLDLAGTDFEADDARLILAIITHYRTTVPLDVRRRLRVPTSALEAECLNKLDELLAQNPLA